MKIIHLPMVFKTVISLGWVVGRPFSALRTLKSHDGDIRSFTAGWWRFSISISTAL